MTIRIVKKEEDPMTPIEKLRRYASLANEFYGPDGVCGEFLSIKIKHEQAGVSLADLRAIVNDAPIAFTLYDEKRKVWVRPSAVVAATSHTYGAPEVERVALVLAGGYMVEVIGSMLDISVRLGWAEAQAETPKASEPEPPPVANPESQDVTEALLSWLDQNGSDAVSPLIRARREYGIAKYNTTLMSHNGRDCVEDARQEAGDLLQYLMQAKIEGRLEEARGALVNVMTAVGDLAHANHE